MGGVGSWELFVVFQKFHHGPDMAIPPSILIYHDACRREVSGLADRFRKQCFEVTVWDVRDTERTERRDFFEGCHGDLPFRDHSIRVLSGIPPQVPE